MAKITLTGDKLAKAIDQELTIYHADVMEKIRDITRESMANLVRKTRASAPVDTGEYRKAIAGDFRGLAKGLHTAKATWYVKAPHYRLTHLLVHEHELVNGKRSTPDPFLENALDEVLPVYEEALKEAIKEAAKK